MAFKLSITAGHYKYTPGKRCLKTIDPNETREWALNSRIAEKVEALLKDYDGIEILRTDDRTGEKEVSLSARTTAANNFGADFYLSIHHNAGIKGGSGGGIVAYVYSYPSDESVSWQKDLYHALIAKTGLKGNRSNPLARSNLHEVREPKMPSVLLELGFMDSTKDTPIILTEDYANKCAEAIVSVIVDRAKLTKKETGVLYRVQVGAYSNKENAEKMVEQLKRDGYSAIITTTGGDVVQSAPKAEAKPEPKPEPEITVGSSVRVNKGAKTYTGGGLASYVYNRTYKVKQIKDDRVVITFLGIVVAAVNKKDLTLV